MKNIETAAYPIVEAIYTPADLPEHAGNPLIEALPPLNNDAQALDAICWQPKFRPEERSLPTALRLIRLLELRNLMVPLERHSEVVHALNAMIRSGYAGRDPRSADSARIAQRLYELQQRGESFRQSAYSSPISLSAALIGLPGLGKTSLVKRWCETLPKVIYHPTSHIYQVPVLMADAPSDGSSMKGFCHSLLHQLDERIPNANYYYEYGVRGRSGSDSLLRNVARLANMHSLGMLIIDETQNFANARKGSQIAMTEIVGAFNELRAPLLFMGTNKAYQVFETDFRSARRAVAVPLSHWDRLRPSAGMDADEWAELVLAMWKFQWVRNPTDLDEWTLQVLYECTQGVLGILTALFATSQMQAMLDRSERITPQLIQRVYQSRFKAVHPMIAALRDCNEAALQKYQDIAPPLEKVLDSIWSVGGYSVPSTEQNQSAPVDGTGAAPSAPRAKRTSRIRSRMPVGRAKTQRLNHESADTSRSEVLPDDYRCAIQLAAERNTSAFEELQRLRLVPTTQEFLQMLW